MSMLRVCLEYAYSMPRVCLGYTYTYRTGGQTPCAMKQSIARHIITSHTCFSRRNTPFLLKKHCVSLGETLRSSVYLSCKQTLLTLLFLISGLVGSWGQDYSGTYYIKSEGDRKWPSGDFYLCSTENWAFFYATNNVNGTDNGQPFLTTHIMDSEKEAKYYKWIIEKHTKDDHDYYAFKYGVDYVDGESSYSRYLSYNRQLTGAGIDRMRIHLKKTSSPDNYELFDITPKPNSTYFLISPKMVDADENNKKKYIVVNGGNTNKFEAYYINKGDVQKKENGPTNYTLTTGIIGTYYDENDRNNPFSLVIPSPTFNLNNDNKVEITALGDADIYYTTDGTDPNVPAEGVSPSAPTTKYTGPIDLINGQIMIKAIATNKDHHVISSSIATYVYNPDITWSETSFVYDGTEHVPTVTSVKVGENVVPEAEYSISCTNNINAETATLTLTDAEENDYYVSGSTTFTIVPKALTITADAKYKDYGDADPTLTYTSEGLVGSDAISGALSRDAGENVGTYAINQNTLTAGDNYAISYIGANLTINKKALTITAKNHTITYGAEPTNAGVTYSEFASGEDESVLEGTLAYAYNYEQYGNVGDYTITPSGLTATNYAISFDNGTLTVGQREVGLTWSEPTSFVYDGTSHGLTATATNLVNGDEIGITVTGDQTNAGNHTATASALTGEKAGNYKLPNENTHAFTITPAALTITAKNHTITYGDAPVGNGVTYSGFIGTEDESVLGGTLGYDFSYTQYGDVGDTYTITPKGLTSTNYDISFVAGTLTVNPKALTITANAMSKTYGDNDPVLTYTSVGLVNDDDITGELSREAGEDVGTYAITQGELTAGVNYIITYTGASFTITRKLLTITADSDTKAYDGTALTKNGFTYEGLLPSDHIDNVTVTGSQIIVGTSDNVPSAAVIKDPVNVDVTANYEITYINGTLTVTKKALSITADAKSKAYGNDDPALTYTSDGLVGTDAITGTLSRVAGEDVGTYAILQNTVTAGDNYEISFTSANLTITKVGLTITANNYTITYGEEPAGDGVTCEGFVKNDTYSSLGGTLDYDFSYTRYDDVGNNYTIMPKGLTSSNYEITFKKGKLTVSPKKVGIAWSETTSFPYDGTSHGLTATATGLVNGDVIGVKVTGAETNAGNHTAKALALTGEKAGNYVLPEVKTQSFTITSKSIGDGTLADCYTLNFGENNTILLTDDVIGSALEKDTDYEVGGNTDNSEGYYTRIVTGIGNYTGSFSVRNAFVNFSTDTDREEWSATFVAEKKNEGDIGFVLPEGFTAFIISDIRGDWAIPEPLNYIPADVPVLLVANHQTQGFVVTEASSSGVTAITPDQKDKNMLEKVTEDTPGYNATTESAPFATKQIYLLYKNEFVFNKAGNLKKGKVFLNPNHITPSPSPAPARLMIAWNYTTGIKDEKWKMEDGSNERWYTLDGRCLSGKPTTKGLYIVNGKKIVIK